VVTETEVIRKTMIDYTTYPLDDDESILVLELTGRLDGDSSEFLLDAIQGLMDEGTLKFVLDCSDLQFISSVGLASLIRANSRLKKISGHVALANVPGAIAEVLRIVHFDRIFHIFDSVVAAADSLRDL
jgi:anti-sigma B factor antagonist